MQSRTLKYRLIDQQIALMAFLERSRKDITHSDKVKIAIEVARLDQQIHDHTNKAPHTIVPFVDLVLPSKI